MSELCGIICLREEAIEIHIGDQFVFLTNTVAATIDTAAVRAGKLRVDPEVFRRVMSFCEDVILLMAACGSEGFDSEIVSGKDLVISIDLSGVAPILEEAGKQATTQECVDAVMRVLGEQADLSYIDIEAHQTGFWMGFLFENVLRHSEEGSG